MSMPEYVTINGTSYASENLSDAARSQVVNVQAADAEIARVQQQLAFLQTARNAYMNALLTELKGKKAAAAPAEPVAEKVKKPRAPRKTAAKAVAA